jgi:Uma2 family endonuclease
MATLHRDRPRQLYYDELHNGDCMTQREFHRLYEQAPEGFKAELLGGVVFVCEPLGLPHGRSHVRLTAILAAYEGSTPGVEVSDNVTVILGKDDEVQPDISLRILPECKGQSKNSRRDLYIHGSPELVAEVAHSSKSIDLHIKKERYTRAGVLEYIVLCLKPADIRWFDLRKGCELTPERDRIFRSRVFPGLWIDRSALLRNNYQNMMKMLDRGLASVEHADFVAKLSRTRGY